MPDLITLTCPMCGAKLKLSDNIHLLACANCGNEHMVRRDGGAIYLAPMAADVQQIRVGVDKTAAELAVARLTREIQDLQVVIEEAKKRDYTELVDAPAIMPWILFVMIADVVLIGVAASIRNVWLANTLVFALIALITWRAYLNHKRVHAGYKLKDEMLVQLQQQYNEKLTALDKNRQIANN